MVAMSGGVDSSVAAALLKKQGCDVFGVFMRLNDFSKESEKRAKKVAIILNIPFRVLNLRKEFKKRVIDYFVEGYKKGITPNPCVVCNKEIKFGLLMEKALGMGVDLVATGHYSRFDGKNLLRGVDDEKDQSYFLWGLGQKRLGHVLFPLGNYKKDEVRKLAKKMKLPVFNAPESQEICFVKNDINSFLKKYIEPKPGNIINPEGKVLGKHEGLPFYTIGQRKGIKLAGGPYYVINKDIKRNNLVVSKNNKDLLRKEIIVKDASWICGAPPKMHLKIKAKIRYRSKSVSAIITKNLKSKALILRFISPQRAATPGQSAVFYLGQKLLGGGIIC